jgi:glycosyltransferase involved in cell wall biosynthesis
VRIGFDASQTGANKAGCGYMAHSLIDTLTRIDRDNHYILYSNFGPDFWDPDHAQGTYNARSENGRSRNGRSPNLERRFTNFSHYRAKAFWSDPTADFEEKLGRPDIIHSNNYYCPTGLQQARLVYSLYDLAFLEHPEYTTEANRLVCFNGVFEAGLRADAIITISQFSRQHFLSLFPHYAAENVHVVPLASRFEIGGPASSRQVAGWKPALSGQYWLSVATLEPRKNLRRLLKAYADLKHTNQTDLPLVMAGGKGWLEDGLRTYIQELDIQNHVYLTGYVDDPTLQWLYQNCFAFVYPSLFEGFGLPVVEAMSLGAAVITSATTSLPEVTGDAAVLINPEDVDALAEAMRRLENDSGLRTELQQKSLIQAGKFSWEKSAEQVLGVYSAVSQQ